ncbi:hypothetical protein [Avrilella dinanensis]|uniref:hypothetical protein n=1 Tax=Avrilella dinanensis TaxID=2008672 RepID=UPI0024090F03|nr:hypothetical protein [Avrilella dinanensis]
MYVDDIELEFDNALKAGAKIISSVEARDWGGKVCYFADIDEHIIAFAQKNKMTNNLKII